MEVNHILKGNQTKAPGVKNEILFAAEEWFDVIGQPSNTEDGTGSLSTITTNHTFLPGYGFVRLQIADRTGEFTAEEVGEPESEAVNATAMGFYPGLNRLLLSYMGRPFSGIVLQQDLDCEEVQYYQVGASCSPARKEGWKFGTGKSGGEGKKGVDVKFTAYQAKVLIYQGAVTLAPQPAQS